jgi:hypothetical protein
VAKANIKAARWFTCLQLPKDCKTLLVFLNEWTDRARLQQIETSGGSAPDWRTLSLQEKSMPVCGAKVETVALLSLTRQSRKL